MIKVAVIPARSGSKGLKDKNIIDLCGKPLMAYSIEAALESGSVERVIVSTDSEKYGRIASSYGAEVMLREEGISRDDTPTYKVVIDILNHLGQSSASDHFVLLQPTSPMRTSAHIKEAISIFEKNIDRFDFLVSVKEAEYANILVRPIGEDGSMRYFDTDFSSYKRQAYKDYSPNGAIFIGKAGSYIKQRHFFGARSMAYKMSVVDSIDIDDHFDLAVARLFMQERIEKECKGGKTDALL